MPLWLLGLLVAGGISLIVFLVHAGGGSNRAFFANAQSAASRWAEDFPETMPLSLLLAQDKSVAVLQLESGAGLVAAIGDCFLTRHIHLADVALARADGATLDLRLRDFAFTGGRWRFGSPEEAQKAVDWLMSKKG